MKVKCFLVIGATVSISGAVSSPKIRTCIGKPSLGANEISVALEVDVPDALFVRPAMQASITIPKDSSLPETIPVSVQNDIVKSIRQQTGLVVHITAEQGK